MEVYQAISGCALGPAIRVHCCMRPLSLVRSGCCYKGLLTCTGHAEVDTDNEIGLPPVARHLFQILQVAGCEMARVYFLTDI